MALRDPFMPARSRPTTKNRTLQHSNDSGHEIDKGQHFHIAQTGRILKDIMTMITIVQIIIRVCDGLEGSLHAGRITLHDKNRTLQHSDDSGHEIELWSVQHRPCAYPPHQ